MYLGICWLTIGQYVIQLKATQKMDIELLFIAQGKNISVSILTSGGYF